MILEKVYDELYGMIEDLKKKVASISGGSVVTITPTLESGEKLAEYSIDGTEGAIYAPPIMEYFSTNERIIGEWIDGELLYRKVIMLPARVSVNSDYSTVIISDTTELDIYNIIDCIGLDNNGGDDLARVRVNTGSISFVLSNSNTLIANAISANVFSLTGIILTYTKTPAAQNTRTKTTKKK